LKEACREAVAHDIREVRSRAGFSTGDGVFVHHAAPWPFERLVAAFTQERPAFDQSPGGRLKPRPP
jgi:hypothetical protein